MPNSNVPVITIDGPTASGKGTVASRVAERLSFHLLDSGALYRLTALQALRREVELRDEHAIAKLAEHLPARFQGEHIFLAQEDVTHAIRAEEVGAEGFTVVFATWGDTRVARVRASWLAIGPADHPDDFERD